jgi:hypothetical protein
MLAAVTIDKQQSRPCIVRWTGRKSFIKIVVQSYCGEEVDASEFGVMQLPDKVMITGHLCPACIAAFRSYELSLSK